MAERDDSLIVIEDDEDDEVQCIDVNTEKLEKDRMDCPICLQTCIHPAKLPCGHIFCFLCVKGVAYKNRRCAMCRREIPPEFLERPELVHGIQDLCKTSATEDGYQWFYEGRNGWWEYDSRTSEEIEEAFKRNIDLHEILICGNLYEIDFKKRTQTARNSTCRSRNIRREKKGFRSKGWWQYDERTSQDIEEAYKKGEKSCKILVAGFVYVVDFEAMLQQRQNDPSRRRHVKRDLATIPKKGVAGLRIEGNAVATDSDQRNDFNHRENSNFISTIAATDAAIRIASDIIGSTLAHADEINRTEERQQQNILPSLDILEQAEEIMESTQADNLASSLPVVVHPDLFSQTLEDFRSLTIRNIVDSSDSETENEQLIL